MLLVYTQHPMKLELMRLALYGFASPASLKRNKCNNPSFPCDPYRIRVSPMGEPVHTH